MFCWEDEEGVENYLASMFYCCDEECIQGGNCKIGEYCLCNLFQDEERIIKWDKVMNELYLLNLIGVKRFKFDSHEEIYTS